MSHDGSLWQLENIRGYVAAMEVLPGLGVVLRAEFLADPVQTFAGWRGQLHLGERVLAVLERRRTAENLGTLPWYVFGAIALALAAGTYFQMMPAVASYLLVYITMAAITGVTLLRMRNRGERRAALLEPRGAITRVVPAWLFAVATVATLASLALFNTPGIGFAALVATLVGLAIIAAAWIVGANMAAMLVGDDPAVEVAVEQVTRRRRVVRLLLLAAASSLYFIMISTRSHALGGPAVFAAALLSFSAVALLCFWDWYHRARVNATLSKVMNG